MFNSLVPKPVSFRSNPPLGEKVVVVPVLNEAGSPVNHIKVVPGDNKSLLDGVHFTREEMSLRSKLNLGVKLTKVPNVGVINDPSELSRIADNFDKSVVGKLDKLRDEEAAAAAAAAHVSTSDN